MCACRRRACRAAQSATKRSSLACYPGAPPRTGGGRGAALRPCRAASPSRVRGQARRRGAGKHAARRSGGAWACAPHQEEAVREADLHAAQQRRHARAVRGQVGEVARHDRRGGHRRLQHPAGKGNGQLSAGTLSHEARPGRRCLACQDATWWQARKSVRETQRSRAVAHPMKGSPLMGCTTCARTRMTRVRHSGQQNKYRQSSAGQAAIA